MNVDMAMNILIDELGPNNSNSSNGSIDEEYDVESKKWQPKKWKAEYEKIVLMSIGLDMKGVEIAEKMGCTPAHVYNILSTDEAIAIEKALIGKIREDTINIADEISEIQKLTVRRLKTCLLDDDTFKTSRLGFITKGIDIMKGTGEHLKNAPTNQVNNQFVLPASVADRFIAGLEKSDEARKLLAAKNEEIEDAVVIE